MAIISGAILILSFVVLYFVFERMMLKAIEKRNLMFGPNEDDEEVDLNELEMKNNIYVTPGNPKDGSKVTVTDFWDPTYSVPNKYWESTKSENNDN